MLFDSTQIKGFSSLMKWMQSFNHAWESNINVCRVCISLLTNSSTILSLVKVERRIQQPNNLRLSYGSTKAYTIILLFEAVNLEVEVIRAAICQFSAEIIHFGPENKYWVKLICLDQKTTLGSPNLLCLAASWTAAKLQKS